MKSCFTLLTALFLGASLSAHADILTTYKVSGSASDGGCLTGSAVLDETTGRFLSSEIDLSSYGYNLVFSGAPFYSGAISGSYFLSAFFGNIPGSYFYLSDPGSSMVDYAGGPVVGSVQLPINNTSLRSLSLTPENDPMALSPTPAPTPEPASLLLLGTGIVALWGFAAVVSGGRAASESKTDASAA